MSWSPPGGDALDGAVHVADGAGDAGGAGFAELVLDVHVGEFLGAVVAVALGEVVGEGCCVRGEELTVKVGVSWRLEHVGAFVDADEDEGGVEGEGGEGVGGHAVEGGGGAGGDDGDAGGEFAADGAEVLASKSGMGSSSGYS